MNTRKYIPLLAAAVLALGAQAQHFVYNGDIVFSGTVTVRGSDQSSSVTPVTGQLEVGFSNGFGADDFGVQLRFDGPGGGSWFFFKDGSPDSFGAVWGAGLDSFTFSLAATEAGLYAGDFFLPDPTPLIGEGMFSLVVQTSHPVPANVGPFGVFMNQITYDASTMAPNPPNPLDPFLALSGSFSASGKAGDDDFVLDLVLGYGAGLGSFDPLITTPGAAPVPEPSTYGLMGVGLLIGLVAYRRFRAKKVA
jgi:hypothetical protein